LRGTETTGWILCGKQGRTKQFWLWPTRLWLWLLQRP
jgi:hypothetical protein